MEEALFGIPQGALLDALLFNAKLSPYFALLI